MVNIWDILAALFNNGSLLDPVISWEWFIYLRLFFLTFLLHKTYNPRRDISKKANSWVSVAFQQLTVMDHQVNLATSFFSQVRGQRPGGTQWLFCSRSRFGNFLLYQALMQNHGKIYSTVHHAVTKLCNWSYEVRWLHSWGMALFRQKFMLIKKWLITETGRKIQVGLPPWPEVL